MKKGTFIVQVCESNERSYSIKLNQITCKLKPNSKFELTNAIIKKLIANLCLGLQKRESHSKYDHC